MTNAVDCLLHQEGPVLYEIRIMSETAGDTILDVNSSVTKRVRIYGIFRLATAELFQQLGVSSEGDAVVYVRKRIDMTSQIQHEEINYEIRQEIPINPLNAGSSYTYILTRFPDKQ